MVVATGVLVTIYLNYLIIVPLIPIAIAMIYQRKSYEIICMIFYLFMDLKIIRK